MALKVSNRGQIPPFIVMDVLSAANKRQAGGEDIIHLELGEPATPAPTEAIQVAQSALEAEPRGYTEACGRAPLRARIAEFYRLRYGIAVDAERIVVTTGSSGGFVLSFLAAFDPGDRVALADPSYPAYRNILLALGVEPVALPAKITGSTGNTHGEMAVTRPATNAMPISVPKVRSSHQRS